MKIERYFERIGWKGDAKPDLATLRGLHRAHLLAIPYENLDVQLGRRVTIERPAIYKKMVENRRGGWCYEMNGLFGWALAAIGFKVMRGAGAVMREASGDAAIGNHLVLRVDLDEGIHLADVGFGDGPIEPFPIAAGDFRSRDFEFGLSALDSRWWRLKNHPHGGAPSFDFTLEPADERLLAEKCEFLQSSEQSIFVQNVFCMRHTPKGVTVLRGRVLRHVSDRGIEDESLISDADEFVSVLAGEFGLDLPEAATLWPKIMARHEALFAPQSA